MELRRYLTLIWKWAWLLVLGMVLGGAGSYLFSKSLTPIYSASTTLMVQPSSGQNGTSGYQDVLMAERLAGSYTQLITGRTVLMAAADAMQLPASFAQMSRLVTADVVRNTQLIRVSAEHEDPTVAARIANQVAAEFIKKNENDQLDKLQTSRSRWRRRSSPRRARSTTRQRPLRHRRSRATARRTRPAWPRCRRN